MIALNVIPDLKGGCGMDRKWVNWNDDATEKSVFEYDGAEVICKTFAGTGISGAFAPLCGICA